MHVAHTATVGAAAARVSPRPAHKRPVAPAQRHSRSRPAVHRLLQWLDAALLGEPGPVADPHALQLTEPQDTDAPQSSGQLATFAAGCFWHVQHALAATPGVTHTVCGYTQGKLQKPTYAQVCTGRSGHVEAVRVEFDPLAITYAQLLDVWWSCIEDPTDGRGQGADRGRQYRLGIYYYDAEQRMEAQAFLAAKAAHHSRPLAVEVKPAAQLWPAEEVHQCYIAKGGLDPHPETPFWMGQFVDT